MSILDKIIEHKLQEISKAKQRGIPDIDIPDPQPRGFIDSLTSKPEVSIIAEVKKASPSKGLICADFDPEKIAQDYKEGGASAISVLTDENFFQGSLNFLPLIRQTVDLPLLRKDFIIDHFQIEEAKAFGADAILLIVAVLDKVLLSELLAHATEQGLDCLVEVHDPVEAEKALNSGAALLGVNNRNLKDFTVSLDTTFQIKKLIPENVPLVSESGISTPKDIIKLKEANIQAALVGESVVKDPHRPQLLKELVRAGS